MSSIPLTSSQGRKLGGKKESWGRDLTMHCTGYRLQKPLLFILEVSCEMRYVFSF